MMFVRKKKEKGGGGGGGGGGRTWPREIGDAVRKFRQSEVTILVAHLVTADKLEAYPTDHDCRKNCIEVGMPA